MLKPRPPLRQKRLIEFRSRLKAVAFALALCKSSEWIYRIQVREEFVQGEGQGKNLKINRLYPYVFFEFDYNNPAAKKAITRCMNKHKSAIIWDFI